VFDKQWRVNPPSLRLGKSHLQQSYSALFLVLFSSCMLALLNQDIRGALYGGGMNIGLFQYTHSLYGGAAYEKMLAEVLSSQHSVSEFDVRTRYFNKGQRPRVFLSVLLKQIDPKIDLWIRNKVAVAAMQNRSAKKRNIALCHHLDGPEVGNYWVNRGLGRLFLRNARKCDCVVVVAEFWKEYLESKGIERVKVIRNAFRTESFSIQEKQVYEFKKKYDLLGKPIIYIGNCQKIKGAADVYEILRPLKLHLVSSGIRDIDLPVRNFTLSYSEYILLLSACDAVITMSQFLEGWNRVAHEAMLCRTPVIGSGSGGMRELLEGGEQIICERIQDIPEHLEYALKNSALLGDKGYGFASQFTLQKFRESWLALVESL
jgi:glycosyltransferase involved in cell wall biosynthesis